MAKKIQIVLAALAGFMAISAGAAEWNTILDNSRLKIEVDAAGALKGNNVIEAWDEEVYTQLEQASPGDFYFKSVKSLARYGCKEHTTDRLMRIYFDQDGVEIKKVSEADGSAYVVPDTLEEMKFEYLCNHKLPPETARLIAEKKARLAAEKAAEKARLKALAKAKAKAKTKSHARKAAQPSKEYQAYLEAKRRAEAREAQLKPAADAKPQVVVPPAAVKPATTAQPVLSKPATATKPATAPAPVATPAKAAAVTAAPAKKASGITKPILSLPPPPPPVVPKNP